MGGRHDRPHDEAAQQPFTEEGFALAKDYYERFILQYPHTQYSKHALNATAFYPALFNIWIFAAQDRAKRARVQLEGERPSSSDSASSTSSLNRVRRREIRGREREDAVAVASRMDEVLLGPPYDADETLLLLRGFVGMWVADLCGADEDVDASEVSEASGDGDRAKAISERRRARELFSKLSAQGVDLSAAATSFLESEDTP